MGEQNRFWCILALKSDICWQPGNNFNDFPENQLPKSHPLPSRLREVIFKDTQFDIQRVTD